MHEVALFGERYLNKEESSRILQGSDFVKPRASYFGQIERRQAL